MTSLTMEKRLPGGEARRKMGVGIEVDDFALDDPGSCVNAGSSPHFQEQSQRIVEPALRAIGALKNGAMTKSATRLLLELSAQISQRQKANVVFNKMPSIHAFDVVEDGSLLVEWAFPNFRVGFTFEADSKSSGWYLVSNKGLGGTNASGYLSKVDKKVLIAWLLHFVVANAQNSMTSYPEECLRGIPNASYLPEGVLGSHLFYFDDVQHMRQDGRIPQSINWVDEPGAVSFTLQQVKESGELQFKAGVAVIPKCNIDDFINLASLQDALSYERDVKPENPYHGNLLLASSIPQLRMKQIAASMALLVSGIVKQS